ncbi:MAG: pyrroline-5-carboxylate reductase [Desulfovibrionaceae bacterium]|jgi:pyrroline-5-carboxylate reductase|nr:pyrroline-5-carboxylate reductase [Desulfovibrionaceae bacterium]
MHDSKDAAAGPATLGVIGCGNMGGAILRGLAGRPDLALHGFDLNAGRVQALAGESGVVAAESPRAVADACDYVLVAVKPHHVAPLLAELAPFLRPDQIIVSIAAGMSVAALKEASSGVCPVVRVMPNTPAMVGQGVFAVCFDDPALTPAAKDFLQGLFRSLGQVHVLGEDRFDAFTAVAGSGPAYVFYFMEAIVEAGVTLGLTRAQSTEMVKKLFSGSAALAEETSMHLSELREMVTSPAGTTIAATNVLDLGAVRGKIVEAVKAASDRSREMGKKK